MRIDSAHWLVAEQGSLVAELVGPKVQYIQEFDLLRLVVLDLYLEGTTFRDLHVPNSRAASQMKGQMFRHSLLGRSHRFHLLQKLRRDFQVEPEHLGESSRLLVLQRSIVSGP